MSKPYNWYRHHAWGGMAMMSILLVIHALIGVPPWVLYPAVGLLLVYIVISLVLTYISSPQLKDEKKTDEAMARTKEEAKAAKKAAKAEAKRKKKEGKK